VRPRKKENMQKFTEQIQKQFNKLAATGKLFRSEVTGDQIWNAYMSAFEQDPIFRDPASSEHNCNLCKNFIRRYGNIVAVVDNKVESLFDFEIEGEFRPVVIVLSGLIRAYKIKEVFFETYAELNSLNYEKCSKTASKFKLGVDKNTKMYNAEEAAKYGVVKEGEIKTFHHLHLTIPTVFVDQSGKSVEAIMGEYRDAKNVFKRALDEISVDTLKLVKDLAVQGSLLDIDAHIQKIDKFIPFMKEYAELPASQKDNYAWVNSYKLPIAKFRNELLGVLCSELSEGKELNAAVLAWNKRVDPKNYMKATAPITKKQIEDAKNFVIENGYEESFNRRFANIDDIKVSEILHSNVGDGKLKSVSIFDSVKSTSTRHKRSEFDKVEEVTIDKFMKDILPSCTSVEAFLTAQQEGNMVSLTTANEPDSKPIFKWSNNYSWTYNGNLAGKSQIREEVKNKGGKVDGVLRFSMMWADGDGDNSDLDLHCIEPKGNEIYFSNKRNSVTGGNLDIDITGPNGKLAVENITFPDLNRMQEGVYKLFIRQFSARGSRGFKAEIEFNGELYSYIYDKPVSGDVQIAQVTLKGGVFTIKHILPATEGEGVQKEVYGLETNQFHKVNLISLSPNHWDDNNVGNKHYFFMLDGAKCPTSIRSFHNENLIAELAAHRKVLEVLGAQTMIEPSNKQLSGLGFNATVRDELVVKLSGNFKRVIKIKF
jgi:hypothetical protein